ncbi:MAG: hypothetical protein GY806_21725, partial [Gammaproteobacteria bacterium]|nr:hypothetical protein [Gammaproteobacteria bacterium]
MANTDWVEYAQILADYKTATGMPAQVLDLGGIIAAYSGVDEAEQIKRAIHNEVVMHNVQYVILVGDFGVFPVRYQATGYMSNGANNFSFHESYCNKVGLTTPCVYQEGYKAIPVDAYFANLWSDDADPVGTFEDWDFDNDGFFGELYCGNALGTDKNTVHQDVAVGRIPANSPDEFLRYVTKVLVYENRVPGSPYQNRALLLSDDFGGRWQTEETFGATFGPTFDLTYLVEAAEGGFIQAKYPDGPIFNVDTPTNEFVRNYLNSNFPRFVNHAGHGHTGGWSFDLDRHSVITLTNWYHPAVVASSGCWTAQFASYAGFPDMPVTPYSGSDRSSMAEAFITEAFDAGVIYIGSPIENQRNSLELNELFFENAIHSGVETVGDAWLAGLEAILADPDYDVDNFRHIPVSDWPDERYDYKCEGNAFYVVNKMMIFGDPSLRIDGISSPDYDSPVTIASLKSWVNSYDLARAIAGDPYEHQVYLDAQDNTAGVLTSVYRYRTQESDPWTAWQHGANFSVPVVLDSEMEGESGSVQFKSVDRLGNMEDEHTAEFGYDFTPPVSSISADGELLPTTIDGEWLVSGHTVTISSVDNFSGVKAIWYRFLNDGKAGEDSFAHYSHKGNEIIIERPFCMPGTTIQLEYWAEDKAGNLETPQTVTMQWQAFNPNDPGVCLQHLYEQPFTFPPRLRDELQELRFDEAIFGQVPISVAYEISGPVTTEGAPTNWINIGDALHDKATATWLLKWDTVNFGIENGWYLLRPVIEVNSPMQQSLQSVTLEPVMLLIDNVSPNM